MLDKFYIACTEENHWTLTDATRADDKIIFLRDEYKKFWQKILRGENFALKETLKIDAPNFSTEFPARAATRRRTIGICAT